MTTLKKSLFWAFSCLTSIGAFCANPLIQPQQLRVEHMENPSVIDTHAPRLSWINQPADASIKNAAQSAYRITVASTPKKLKEGKYDIWDSGKISSSESYLINYNGSPLEDGADYYWRVMVWDNNGNASKWSDTGKWGMGFTDQTRWKARWIGAPWQGEETQLAMRTKGQQSNYPAPLLRKDFTTKKNIVKAKAYVTGLGYFELFINGKKVGNDLLVPNFTNYTKRHNLNSYSLAIDDSFTAYRVMYLAYDVTNMLYNGNNTIGAILGNGFYDTTSSWICPFGSPRFLCQLEITYNDGHTETVTTDNTWKAAPSAIVYNGPFEGEIYDANLEHSNWSTPQYNASSWLPAVYRNAPDGELTAHTAPTDKVTDTFKPLSLTRRNDGSWHVKFPVEISGWIRLNNVQASAGDTININYICDQTLGVHRYIAAINDKINYAPRFTWYVFSEAIIHGVDHLTAENLMAEAVNTEVNINAEFSASIPMLNNINTIWRRSQIDNMHGGVASDCPHRERAAYTGDGQVAMSTVMANFDAAAFYRKWIRDMRDCQNSKSGYVPNGAPWQPGCGGGVAWGAAMNIMPWDFYMRYADKAMLAENYQAMKAQVAYMLKWLTEHGTMLMQLANSNDPTNTPAYWLNLGDWCAPDDKLPPQELVHTFFLWRCIDNTAKAAHALNLATDEAFYSAKAREIANNFHKRFYNPEAKSYGDFGANVFALEIGVPEEVHADVVNTLAHEISVTHNGHLNTGIFASRHLFEQLGKNGLNDLALTAMTAADYPGFGNWLSQGATTTWEQWDGKNSHNHPMFGGSLMWYYNTLAGIQMDENAPGFRHFIVKPVLATKLTSVRYSTMSPYGLVASEVNLTDNLVSLTVTVPVGSTATVMLPLHNPTMKVYAEGNSTPLKGTIAEPKLKGQTHYFVTTVAQGTHHFTAQ